MSSCRISCASKCIFTFRSAFCTLSDILHVCLKKMSAHIYSLFSPLSMFLSAIPMSLSTNDSLYLSQTLSESYLYNETNGNHEVYMS